MPFVKGQSGNPTGRPRGGAGLARFIAERTSDMRVIAEGMIDIFTNPAARPADRIAAANWLGDRAYGKPVTTSNVNLTARAIALPAGWESMTNAERLAWADQLRSRALTGATGLLGDGDEDV